MPDLDFNTPSGTPAPVVGETSETVRAAVTPVCFRIDTVTSVAVDTGVYSDTVLSAASRFLSGDWSSYIFFQFDSSQYILIRGDIRYYNGSFICEDCTLTEIVSNVSTITHNHSFSISGELTELSQNPSISDFSGTYDTAEYEKVESLQCYTVGLDYLAVSNPDAYIMYCSPDLVNFYPDLRQGVDYYAFTLCLFVVVYGLYHCISNFVKRIR